MSRNREAETYGPRLRGQASSGTTAAEEGAGPWTATSGCRLPGDQDGWGRRGRGQRAPATGCRETDVDGLACAAAMWWRHRSEGGGRDADGERRPRELARAQALHADGSREERWQDFLFQLEEGREFVGQPGGPRMRENGPQAGLKQASDRTVGPIE